MPKNDPFTMALKADLQAKDLTYEAVAEMISLSRRQFARHVRGETKQGLMPIEIVAELRKEGVISESTVDQWFINTRRIYHLKRNEPRRLERSLIKLVKQIISQR